MNLIRGKSPQEAVSAICSANPKFREFYEQNKDVPIRDLCGKYGVDYEMLKSMIQ